VLGSAPASGSASRAPAGRTDFGELELQAANPADRDPHMTGLPALTAEDRAWKQRHAIRVGRVRLNQLGLDRVNAERRERGMPALAGGRAEAPGVGAEVVPAEAAGGDAGGGGPAPALPAYVDNSALKFFPPIRSQGSLNSCGVFSGTYYTMTYMHALANDLDARDGGDAFRFSPKWTYNMVNGGTNAGTWYFWAFGIGRGNGCSTWTEFPYVGSTSPATNYREWCLAPEVWRSAINRRFDQQGYVSDTDTDAGMAAVKALLANGYVLNYATFINSWKYKVIGDDPATGDDNAFTGRNCCYFVDGTSGYHAMTVVGYNDSIWVDVNGNGTVDAGEKGAFRIANSWGTLWQEAGFCWIAYDALRSVSAVAGGPSLNRRPCWDPPEADWVTARTAYRPQVVARFTVNHALRSQMALSLGISDQAAETPSTVWLPAYVFQNAGGALAFNGTATAVDGTFYMDFSDIVPPAGSARRWYLGLDDSAAGSAGTIRALSLYRVLDVGDRLEGTAANTPRTADAGQTYAWVDYALAASSVNGSPLISSSSPEASFTMDEGQTETFSVEGWDPDGDALAYAWTLDGAPIAGAAAASFDYSPDFAAAGEHRLVVRVTDIWGAAAEQTWTIRVRNAVILRARDQHGAEVAGAAIYVPSRSAWYVSGDRLRVEAGKDLVLRGRALGVTGPKVRRTVAVGDTEVSVPFWRTVLRVRDRDGADVDGVLIRVRDVAGSPFAPGTELVLPVGATVTARAVADVPVGPWITRVFQEGLDELTVRYRPGG